MRGGRSGFRFALGLVVAHQHLALDLHTHFRLICGFSGARVSQLRLLSGLHQVLVVVDALAHLGRNPEPLARGTHSLPQLRLWTFRAGRTGLPGVVLRASDKLVCLVGVRPIGLLLRGFTAAVERH